MRNAVIAILLAFGLSGCVTDEDETVETLQKSGFTQIHPGDLALWSCGEHDKTGREFTAMNPTGQRVSGVVCCGVWKSCTVRF